MMTGLVGTSLPVASAAPPADGVDAAVDPAGAETFLAALVAAVAAPTPAPAPAPTPIVVVHSDATLPTEEGTLDGGNETAPLRAGEEPAEGVERAPAASTTPVAAASGRPRSDAPIADAAPRETLPAPRSATAVPRNERADEVRTGQVEGTSDTPSERPEDEMRAESASPADPDVRPRSPGQGEARVPAPATPSMHASAHALAAPPRQPAQRDEPPAGDAPKGRPVTPGASAPAMRPLPASASATAAGVLAAMHAARESSAMPPTVLADEVLAAVATSATVVGPSASGRVPSEVAPDAPPAMVEPMGSPDSAASGEHIVARPVVVVADDGGAGSAGQRGPDQDAERDRPRLVVTTEATAEPTQSLRTPFAVAAPSPGAEAAPTAVTLPDAAPSADAPPARVATSHVTVELDVEQSGAERVRVAVRGDVVHATVVTDRGGVDAMRPQLDQLRHALEGQGFREAHVQVRSSGGEATGAMAPGGVADLRPRAEAASRTPDGSASEQQPRGRHRGQDHSPPEGRHHEHEEEIL